MAAFRCENCGKATTYEPPVGQEHLWPPSWWLMPKWAIALGRRVFACGRPCRDALNQRSLPAGGMGCS